MFCMSPAHRAPFSLLLSSCIAFPFTIWESMGIDPETPTKSKQNTAVRFARLIKQNSNAAPL